MHRKPASRSPKAGPRKREAERIFQIGAYWLGYEAGSDYLFYYWYDEGARRTRRKTTGKRDLEDAKLWLSKLVIAEPPDDPLHPDLVTMAAVKSFYFEHHAKKIRSIDAARQSFKLVSSYLRAAIGEDEAPKIGHLTLARQEAFMLWCRDEHRLSAKTISTYLGYLKAGLRVANTPRLIRDARGREREARVLSSIPYINSDRARVVEVTGLPASKPRDWIPTDGEMAATVAKLDTTKLEPAFRYAIGALNTWARPEAITDLSVKAQVSVERRLIDLNPPGRTQTKKIRPVIRLTDNYMGWLLYWNLDRPISINGRPVAKINNRTLQAAAMSAGVAEWKKFTKYTFRHYMATKVRTVLGVTVPREERAMWMGHVDPIHRTTQKWYETFDADYLVNAMHATDAIMLRLDQLSSKPLFSPDMRPSHGPKLLKLQANS